MSDLYSSVKVHKRSLHKTCMQCRRPATVTSESVVGRTTMDGWYCHPHAVEGGVVRHAEDRR